MSSAALDPLDAADDHGIHPSLRILVVDADDRTRESIVGILGIGHRFDVVGSASHIAEAISLAKQHHPDVVVLDPRLPEVSGGLSLIRRLRAIDPLVHVLVVGWSPDLEHESLAAGADAFVRKTFKSGDLAGAIGRCMTRGHVAEAHVPAFAEPLGRTAAEPDPGPVPRAERA